MSEREEIVVSPADGPTGGQGAAVVDDARAATFTETRPLLFSIAYRMLGSVADAEDLVQDAFLRWQQAPAEEIRAPRAYLTTIVTRLAINQLNSAPAARELRGPLAPGAPRDR